MPYHVFMSFDYVFLFRSFLFRCFPLMTRNVMRFHDAQCHARGVTQT